MANVPDLIRSAEVTRRFALLSPLAAAACAAHPAPAPADAIFRSVETLSESVHSGVTSADGKMRLTVRLCRYPDLGLAWIWVHARTPAGFFSYVDHMSPCGREPTPASDVRVAYADLGATLRFEREGAVTGPTGARITGQCLARRSPDGRLGPGRHRLEATIAFSPERLYSGLNEGRTEVFGRSRATVSIDGESFEIEGPAQFHEQRQTTPRFTAAFAYGTLWGEGAACTLLLTARRQEGYVLEGERATDIKAIRLQPPGASRTVAVELADGRTLEGLAETLQGYTVPVVGRPWRGHMVRLDLGGRRYFGHINDFLGEGVPYAA